MTMSYSPFETSFAMACMRSDLSLQARTVVTPLVNKILAALTDMLLHQQKEFTYTSNGMTEKESQVANKQHSR